MTSTSSAGVVDRSRCSSTSTATIDVAEQEVQAAINAGDSLLPADLPAPPVYAKVNPADAPVLTLAVTSDTLPLPRCTNSSTRALAQKISQVCRASAWSRIGGGQQPAVRIQADPQALAVARPDAARTCARAIAAANANQPKGSIDGPRPALYTINANDQLRAPRGLRDADHRLPQRRAGAPARRRPTSSTAPRTSPPGGLGERPEPAVLLNVQRQPGANVIDVVDAHQGAAARSCTAGLPPAIDVAVLSDRTQTIRASVEDVQHELLLTIVLVVLVIFLFLRNLRATVIPSVAVPLSLIGTFGVMYLPGYSLNNLTLMALTIATGFVVDDAIVMIENIARYIEEGETPFAAALQGREADRLHHRLADGVADRGADPAAVHGRRRRPAVPRVRGDAGDHDPDLGGGVADADADDVGALAQAPARAATHGSARPRSRAPCFDGVMRALRPRAARVLRAPGR